jgi:hypothetical protein
VGLEFNEVELAVLLVFSLLCQPFISSFGNQS